MIIVLLGYMGAGKTSVGKNLAKILSHDFIDLDDYISENEGLSIPEIFDQKGEVYFRKIESLVLRELINSKNNLVLSLGGGTPCYSNNMNLLNTSQWVKTFYLKLSYKKLAERLMTEKSRRPLIAHLKTEENFSEFVAKHLFERSSFYNQANFVLDCDDKTIQEIAENVVANLI